MSSRLAVAVRTWVVMSVRVLFLVVAGAAPGQGAQASTIVINEICCDPANGTGRVAFIELYNAGTLGVDLGGWHFDEGIGYTFPQGTTVPADGYVVVAEDPVSLQQKAGITCYGPFEGLLASEGQRIVLRDASGYIVDQVEYKLGFPWPTDTQGRSIELIHPQLDNDLGGSWRVFRYGMALPESIALAATPGAKNSVWAANAPPQIRQVAHLPQQPKSEGPITVTAKITDPDGVGEVTLAYQIVRPGHYVPAWLPLAPDVLKVDATTARQANPDFEDSAHWTTLRMTDDGTGSDVSASDGVFTAVIPGQPHRTLVRYRITAVDRSDAGLSITVPYANDATLNFACWVYDGVPPYVANTHSVLGSPHTYSPDVLETLPVYTLITRAEDLAQCYAYEVSDQLAGSDTQAREAFNWEGAFVFEGVVYDHVNYRLRGGDDRYDLAGKRSMKIRFNRGHELQAEDRFGRPYALGWQDLNVSKMFDGRTGAEQDPAMKQGNFGLTEAANSILWNLMGVPTWDTHWFHFRVVQGEQEAPDQYHGDFWGLFLAMEAYDGRFLQQRGLPEGNLYTLPSAATDEPKTQRHQGRDSVSDASDYQNLRNQLVPGRTEGQLRQWVNYDEFYRYLAVAEAVRHYDFPERGYDENVAFYFDPDPAGLNPYGWLWYLPYDTDLTWGPNANDGLIAAWTALEPDGNDGKAHTENAGGLTGMKLQFRNCVREFRDLLWNPQTINPMLDDLGMLIADLAQADRDRWTNVPDWAHDAGQHNTYTWSVDDKLADMKWFAWTGNHTWSSINGSGYVPSGGQTVVLDQIANQEGDAGAVPDTPTATYTGPAGFPLDSLTFGASAFSDPLATGTFGAMQWRVAEFSDVNSPDYDAADRKYEIQSLWESDEITPYQATVQIPPKGLQVGHLYRVRVRMKDDTGRWSHWSQPAQFVAGTPLDTSLIDGLRIAEIMVHPAEPPTGHPDAEFVEIKNIGSKDVNLDGVRFIEGIEFTFGNLTLSPGQHTVVVKNQAVFESLYGKDLPIAGQFTGRLDNAGESITLVDSHGMTLVRFHYDPAWYSSTDGAGYSLVAAAPATTGPDDWSVAAAWRPSAKLGGSPGKDDPADIPAPGSIVINELLAHSHESASDWIEIYNTTSQPIAIGGWFLSNSSKDLTKFQIYSGTVVPAKGYVVLYEKAWFNNPSAPGCRVPFAFSEAGDQACLSSGYNGQLTGYRERVKFGASERAVSFGRYTLSDGTADFVSLSQETPGAANAYPKVGPVVISEIMYNPSGSSDLEYVELLNVSSEPVALYDAATRLGWRFTDDPNEPGIVLAFSGASNVTISPGEHVLLVRNPAVFKVHYSVPEGTQVFQWAGGKLSNAGAKLDLSKALDIDGTGTIAWLLVDRVAYSDGSHPSGQDPWPAGADGTGMALARIKATDYGNDPVNWKAALPSPGQANP